jgi:hypothetical protein
VTIGRFVASSWSSRVSGCGQSPGKKQISPVAAHDEKVNRFGRIDSSFDDVEKAGNTKSK